MKKLYVLAGMLSVQLAFAQSTSLNVVAVENSGLPSTTFGSVASGEVGGKKALLFTGEVQESNEAYGQVRTQLYLYNGTTFVKDANANFQAIKNGQGIFVDVDKDQDEDVVLIGRGSNDRDLHFKVYENTNGSFSLKQDLNGEGLNYASVDAGDYDADGDLDLLVTGKNTSGARQIFIYQNNNGTFEKKTLSRVKGISQGDAKFVKLSKDNGNKLDFVTAGMKTERDGTVEVYKQNTDGTFSLSQDLEQVGGKWIGTETANLAVVDMDKDGVTDYVAAIGRTYEDFTPLYKNQSGSLSLHTQDIPRLTGSHGKNSAHFTDLDGDNIYELIFVEQEDGETPRAFIYKVVSEGVSEITTPTIEFGLEGSIAVLDYDSDGDLDLYITGNDRNGEAKSAIYRNQKITLSSKEVSLEEKVILYPNPVSQSFAIKGIENPLQISILDVSGKLVKTFVTQSQYDVSSLPKGHYNVVIKGKKGSKTLKMIKK